MSLMRWNCPTDGCYLDRAVVKFDVFSNLFPRGINFTDIDGFVEYEFRFCLMEWKDPRVKDLQTGQELAFRRFANNGNVVFVVFGCVDTMTVERVWIYYNGNLHIKDSITLDELIAQISRWKHHAEVAVGKALP